MAAPLFNQRGFAGCSMQDILDATGLRKGGIYRHFSSKEELAEEAFRYALSQAVKIRIPHGDASMNTVARLREVIAQFVEKPSAVPGGCPILNTAIDADDGNPVLRKLAQEGLKDWRSRISGIVQEGIARREIRPDIEPRALANTIIATLEGALMISRLEGSRSALRDASTLLDEMVTRVALPAK
ncbi:TetR/AcrR family transcriptional regulator [Silvibacterium sp.]|uniref:TetR/AcrR family transcriptional regulator n=1 Tax=Silvibacterium sp. TaxID=1964179 RepID=UPI0039E328EA